MRRLRKDGLVPHGPEPVQQPLDEALLLAEYAAVRQEVLHGIDLQQRALQFGFGAVAVAVTVAFQTSQSADVQVVLAFLLAPLLSYLTVLLWYGELSRCLRASYYLAVLERNNSVLERWTFKYNRWVRFGDDIDGSLRIKRPIIPWAYGGTLLLLLSLPAITIVLAGGALAKTSAFHLPPLALEVSLGAHIAVSAFLALVVVFGLRKYGAGTQPDGVSARIRRLGRRDRGGLLRGGSASS